MKDNQFPQSPCLQELQTTLLRRVCLNTKAFVVDYCARHAHPVNASLHIVGVPMVAVGLIKLIAGRSALGCSLFIGGYVLQYFGHRAQGNEVGEVMLLKKIWRRLLKKTGGDGLGGTN